jgi:Cu/Ag efflux protein CusF
VTKALNQADKQGSSMENVFSKADFEWLFQNSYKMAVKALKSGNPGPVVGLLDISTKVITISHEDI